MLILILVFTMAAPAFASTLEQTPATDKDIQNTVDALAAAVNELKEVFSDKQAKGIIDTFMDFANTLKNASTYVAAINSGVTFLKLIGVVKEENSSSDTPGKDTPPVTPPVPTATDVTSKDAAVTFSATGSDMEINDGANANSDTTRSFERALPWIIGGAVVVAFVAVVLLKANKNKRG